jgi:ABC-type nitrate/sulfonate/bicarbonate transport system ATPase subunit
MSGRAIALENISLDRDGLAVLSDLTLEVARGEFVAVVGPSGCGKTTLLNLISRYLAPTRGAVSCEGIVRMVYQNGGLLPWLTASENILLGLRDVGDDEERERQLAELLALIKLEGFGDQYPHRLSGGMRQRVELARAIAGASDILLMDEPFSALDYLTRLRMRRELARILDERPRTVMLVTHDIEEAAQLADRVVVLSERPAQICLELALQTPRPRDLTDIEVLETVHRVLATMGFEEETRGVSAGGQ